MSNPSSSTRRRVVLVEDDESIGATIVEALATHGYEVEWCRDGETATALLEPAAPDLVLLDAGLPDVDGLTICRWLRDLYRDLPIVLVTARDAEIDIVVGLDAGASDYVTKPFSMNVLLARVRAHLRPLDHVDPMERLTLGRVVIDPAAYQVMVDAEMVAVRPREFELLLVLAREAGKVVTRQRLLADVWDLHWETSTKTLDMHVLALRRKLGAAIDIVAVRGVGYRLMLP
jgi:DNA-binding response OmpR family regulator